MKKLIFSLIIYTGYLTGIGFICTGYYYLHQDEMSVAKSLVKNSNPPYVIELLTGEKRVLNSIELEKENGYLYIVSDGEKFPVYVIGKLNGININKKISERLSYYGITGIVLVAIGSFIFIISLIFRDYI